MTTEAVEVIEKLAYVADRPTVGTLVGRDFDGQASAEAAGDELQEICFRKRTGSAVYCFISQSDTFESVAVLLLERYVVACWAVSARTVG